MTLIRTALSVLVIGLLWPSTRAAAQPLGTFRWQMQPYCNVLTLNIAQQGGIYTLDGTDDRCGAGQAASARGIAFLNPNGSIGFGVTMVQPGGVPVHLETTISLPSLGGTWRDSTGASGNFVLIEGVGSGGPQRPVNTSGVPPGSITAIQLSQNAVAGGNIADGSITIADLLDEPRAAFVDATNIVPVTVNTVVRQVTMVAPTAGRVIVTVSGQFVLQGAATIDHAVCSITTNVNLVLPYAAYVVEGSAAALSVIPFGGTRGFSVPTGSTTFLLVCAGSNASVADASMTAIFVAGS